MATANAQTGTVSASDEFSVNSTLASAHAKKLPKQAQEKLRALSRAWGKSGHMRGALYNAQQEANARRAELSLQIDHLRRTLETGRGIIGPADHKRLAELESERAAEAQTIAELQTDMANLPSAFNPEVLAAWVASANGRFKTFVPPTVELKKNQTAAVALREIRNEISDLVEEIERVRSAHLPSNDAIANAVAEIERIAAKGAVYFGRCRITEPGVNGRTHVGSIRFPKVFVENEERVDTHSLLVFLHKDALIAQAREELLRLDEPDEAMTLAARKPRIAEIEALILGLERKESILVDMAAAQGQAVSYRSSMSPLAILQITPDTAAVPAPKPEAEEPEETPAERAATLRRARLRDRSAPAVEPKTAGADPDDFG